MIPSGRVQDRNRRRELRDAMWLALVPLGVAFVLGVLLLPRRASPESVPLPVANATALARVERSDHGRAERARREPLPGAVRALGSAMRSFHTLEARDAGGTELYDARRAIDAALVDALPLGAGPLLDLRAVQLEAFLDEIHRFASGADESAELQALAGAFVRSLRTEDWCEGHAIAVDDAALRTMFKQMWNGLLGQEANAELAPTLDEQRVLYAFYLSHPRTSKNMREALEAARRGARDSASCAGIAEAADVAAEAWRLERIGRLALIDPTYPADYARGVVSYRRGDFAASAQAFRAWLRDHPDGPLALRAQNFLRAASNAERVE
jgi:hypothetical protein